MCTSRVLLAGGAWLVALSCGAIAAESPQQIHGTSDAFAGGGVAVAWGVLRGASEETTIIALRIAADPTQFVRIAADGVDPFTGQRKAIVGEHPISSVADVRIPRTHFADFPRTELRFNGPASAPAAAAPRLTVFYLGVPDTTPEFATQAKLDAYLSDRIARLRAAMGSKMP